MFLKCFTVKRDPQNKIEGNYYLCFWYCKSVVRASFARKYLLSIVPNWSIIVLCHPRPTPSYLGMLKVLRIYSSEANGPFEQWHWSLPLVVSCGSALIVHLLVGAVQFHKNSIIITVLFHYWQVSFPLNIQSSNSMPSPALLALCFIQLGDCYYTLWRLVGAMNFHKWI